MAMNFAPYQSSPPETGRVASPPPRSAATSPSNPTRPQPQPRISSIADNTDPWSAARSLPDPSSFNDDDGFDARNSGGRYQDIESQGRGGWGRGEGGSGGGVATEVFETSLGFRMEIEACLAYLLLPPAGGVILLIFEHKSDYVRFHAWQSSLVFTALFVLHMIFSWTTVLSWMLFVGDLALIALCVWHAYKDAETLDRFELPFFGPLASRWVDME